MATEEFIIAIEIGSSKVTAIGGKRTLGNIVEVNTIVKAEATDFMRNGMIFNIRKAVDKLQLIIAQLQGLLKCNVTQVYIGHGGQGLHSVENIVAKNFGSTIPIQQDVIKDLMSENRNSAYGTLKILDVVPLEYNVGNHKQVDPIGVLSDYINGHYLNIVARPIIRDTIAQCMSQVGTTVVEYKCIPLVAGDELLTDDEKRSGCMLVDFGADTTTVSVYSKGLLRHVGVVPLGGDNITNDIMSLHIDWENSEKLKQNLGYMDTEELTNEERNAVVYSMIDGTKITKGQVAEVIEARLEEILVNVKEQVVMSGYAVNSLKSGAVLMGGGSNIKNLPRLYKKMVGDCKVDFAKMAHANVRFAPSVGSMRNELNSVLGTLALLVKGDKICTAPIPKIVKPVDMFDQENEEQQEEEQKPVTENNETNEEEQVKQNNPTPPINDKKPSFFKRIADRVKQLSDALVGDDDDDYYTNTKKTK